jgi:protein gp37
MGRTKIEWATDVANFFTGCDRVSPACSDCYALKYAPRLQAQELGRERKALAAGKPPPRRRYMNDGDAKTSGPGFGFTVHWDKLRNPPRFPAGARVFTMSMSDVFHEQAPAEALRLLWLVFAAQPEVNWLVLTKRSDRMRDWVPWLEHLMPEETPWPLPNVWLGVTVENAHWGKRLDDLRATPAAVRWASCEPMLGRLNALDLTDIDWVIGAVPQARMGARPPRRGTRAGRRVLFQAVGRRAPNVWWPPARRSNVGRDAGSDGPGARLTTGLPAGIAQRGRATVCGATPY